MKLREGSLTALVSISMLLPDGPLGALVAHGPGAVVSQHQRPDPLGLQTHLVTHLQLELVSSSLVSSLVSSI